MKPTKKQKRSKKIKLAKKAVATARNESNRKKKAAQLPDFITCNDCGGRADKSSFVRLDASGMDGINVALTGTCSDCGAPTIAVSGDPDAAANLMVTLQNEMQGGKMGLEAHAIN